MKYAPLIAVIIVVLSLSYAGWAVGRKINYYLSYEGMVEQTVCQMVKPEYLKKSCNDQQ